MNDTQPQNCSVLLIDDEALAEDLLGYDLARQAGIRLRYDNRAELAVALCRESEATVVLVDLRMPGADGFDVIRMLRAEPDTEHLPIILLSSEDNAEIKARAFALGANDYLVKWPDARELAARIRYHSAAYLARQQRDAAFAELRQREEELRVSQAALHQSQKMEAIGQLTGGVAHDFNNVLQIISGNLHLVKLIGGVNEQGKARIESALNGVERGARLASHLLAFARRQPLQNAVVELAPLLENMQEMLRPVLGPRISSVTHIDPGLWNTEVDVSQLSNVILNLAINARDAMAGDGMLTIHAGNLPAGAVLPGQSLPSSADHVLLEIVDNGSGMEDAVLQRAFEPFYTTKPLGQGTGLGLSMAYGFIKQSGGEIALQSKAGAGTRVQICLPRSHKAAEEHAVAPSGELTRGYETILVVEDEEAVRADTVDLLSTLGYRVLDSANGEQALRMIEGGAEIDLLFTDVIMPGNVSSMQLGEAIRQQQPKAQILFTSGYAEGVLSHDGKLPPGVHLLQKPYTPEVLSARIRHLLQRRSATAA